MRQLHAARQHPGQPGPRQLLDHHDLAEQRDHQRVARPLVGHAGSGGGVGAVVAAATAPWPRARADLGGVDLDEASTPTPSPASASTSPQGATARLWP